MLANVIKRMPVERPEGLDSAVLADMTQKIEHGEAVSEDQVVAVQGWLEACAQWLRLVRRSDFQHALNSLISELEGLAAPSYPDVS
ncbi:MAG: hypothetical protein JO142_18570 [Burkholderiales bacterium]|nr:hypothetical protein [Burkholderiales bacterium]